MQSRLQCIQEHTLRRDGTARCAHRTKTSTSHLSDASFGDEVGSRALKDAVAHLLSEESYKLRVGRGSMVVGRTLWDFIIEAFQTPGLGLELHHLVAWLVLSS